MALQHLRSSTANKRPAPGSMSDGQLAINTNDGSPGLFFKNSNGALVKIGPVHVGTTAPNASPASGGTAGNSVGEQWLDTSSSRYVFKIWDGTAWRSESGEFVDAAGDVMTGALGIIAGSAGSPGLYVSGDTNTGIYSPGADQLALATGGSGRLFVDASGRLLAGISSTSQSDTNAVLEKSGGAKIYLARNEATPGLSATLGGLYFSDNTHTASAYISTTRDGGTWSASSNPTRLLFATCADGSTSPTERVRITSAGSVGIGTTSPVAPLHVANAIPVLVLDETDGTSTHNQSWLLRNSNEVQLQTRNSTGTYVSVDYISAGSSTGATSHQWFIQNTERARIDSSGRLLVGTSSARSNFFNGGNASQFQVEGTGEASVIRNLSADPYGAMLLLGKSRSTGNTAVQNNDTVALLTFQGNDGSEFVECANIKGEIDGTPGANNMPGRIMLSTTAAGASFPTERARITSGGYFKASDNATYVGSTSNYHEFNQSSTTRCVIVKASNASYAEGALTVDVTRAANSVYKMFEAYSGSFGDREYELRGDGNAFADGTWTGGGADYAEFFEWADSNPDAEDRRGISVVLDGDKIREAQAGEDPIGVISGNPSVVGDGAWNKWNGKYLRDEFGTYILDANGDRQLNPAYDPDVEYIPREQRPEWDCVGLMGKLRIRKGQVTGSRWIKMRDINDSVEEWLVR